MRKKTIPKKAKLITNGGFSKIIDIKELNMKIHIPLGMKVQATSPELYGIPVVLSYTATFELERVTKLYAFYRQIDAVVIIN